ncbi:MAG: Fe-S oxidoreductase [Candidatus Scalindua rubra]|uniref:Fe-S oxidoreductase n=1 Tax=Candidatus Scalindua rubra TaxID=1872076 RepID=A0A1E3XC54_9BACT|nr:MAG: Fe-S oxidoreductase [Candidatus Scalindua rubra]
MSTFDFLHIDARIENGKIVGKAGGSLGEMMQSFVDQFFNKLNTLKVIAKVNGGNVYNLYNPPFPSEAGMRFLARRVRMMLNKMSFPVTANLAITHKCQCQCIHCSADPFIDPYRKELTVDEIKTVIDGSLDLGASLIILVGGEPLLREDIFELIEYVDKTKAIAMIFTNGLLLTDENVKKMAKAGLASLNISIDSSEPELHNEFRVVPKCYERAFEGAERCREAGILTGISTYATSEGIRNGNVEKLLKIAQKEGFSEVTIFDCIPSGRFLKDTSKILSSEDRKQLIALSKKYHEMDHPMGVNAMALINSPKGVGCYGAQSQFYMTAYGDINPCDFNPINFGNVRDMPIQAIWKKMVSHPDFSKRYPTCRMQSKAYRRKYIDTIPEEMRLPIAIERYDNISKEMSLVNC